MMQQVKDRLSPLRLPDLTGRRAVVTGATAGIGLATATALAGAGAEVVLAVRSRERGENVVTRIRQLHPGSAVSVELVDMSSLAGVTAAAAAIGARPVHLLINNAGVGSSSDEERTQDGFTLQVGVNYLASWTFTAGLWPALCAAGEARVVTLGSTMASRGRIGDGFGERSESAYQAYCDSKLAMVVFAGELRRRAKAAGGGVTAVSAHPGWCATAIFGAGGPPEAVTMIGRITGAIQSPADGAQPVLLAATDSHPSAYYGPTKRKGLAGPAGVVPLPAAAREPGVGERLWARSAELSGVAFPL